MTDPSFPDLRSYLSELRDRGELAVVEAPVSARLEAAEVHRRVVAAGGPEVPKSLAEVFGRVPADA